MQNIAAVAHDILESVEPIVDFVKDAAYPCSGMAIGTVCFFFAVQSLRSSCSSLDGKMN